GAVELGHLDDCAVTPGIAVDHVVSLDGNVDALCAFSAYALPKLRELGWRVEIDPAFPWQVVGEDDALYISALPERERPDWFGLELGVEIDGHRVDLLPALLDMIDAAGSLETIAKSSRRCLAVRVDDKRWLPIKPARFALLAKVLLELYRHGH